MESSSREPQADLNAIPQLPINVENVKDKLVSNKSLKFTTFALLRINKQEFCFIRLSNFYQSYTYSLL